MNKIRKYAWQVGFEVQGKLERVPVKHGSLRNSKRLGKARLYMDGKGNEYWVGDKGICIVTSHGAVI